MWSIKDIECLFCKILLEGLVIILCAIYRPLRSGTEYFAPTSDNIRNNVKSENVKLIIPGDFNPPI